MYKNDINNRLLDYSSKLVILLIIFSMILEGVFNVPNSLLSLATAGFIVWIISIIFITNTFNLYQLFMHSRMFLLFIVYIFIVLIFLYKDISSFNRFFVHTFYYISFLLFLMNFNKNNNISSIFRICMWGIVSYLIISNILNPNYKFGLSDVMFGRYEGIQGANFHGYVSALGLIFVFYFMESFSKKSLLSYLLMFYCAFNLYMTGSRGSFIMIMFYILLFTNLFVIKKRLLLKVLMYGLTIVFIFLIILGGFNINQSLLISLRFDEYSLNGRLAPLIYGYEIVKNNNFLPYGLGAQTVNLLLSGRPLDNIFLIMAIEVGLIGVIIIFFFIGKIILKGYFSLQKINRLQFDNRKDRKQLASLISFSSAIVFHGFFENMIFNGLLVGTFILFLILASLCQINENIRTKI